VTLWEIFALGCEPNYKLDADIQLELERGTRLEPPPFWDKETYALYFKKVLCLDGVGSTIYALSLQKNCHEGMLESRSRIQTNLSDAPRLFC